MKPTKIITLLLALLGFAGCDDIGGGRVEYGTPHASFEIKGRVVNEVGNGVPDIKITIGLRSSHDQEYPLAVGITDARGYYEIDGGWGGGQELIIAADDIDGAKNGGEFASQSQKLAIESGDYIGGEGWNRGKVTKNADFTLTPKPQENEPTTRREQ